MFFEFLDLFEKFVDDSSEIIINDLGILHTLTEKKNTLYKIRLGRFLSYQKRGTQKLYGAVTAEELSYVPILNKKTMDFLIKLGVSGLDIDIPTHNLNIANKPELEIAVYMPYALNSYTINCPFTFNGKSWGRSCKRECLNVKLFYENTETEEPFFQRGKAYYRASMKTISPFINRVVILEW
ncbi:MAG: hypothetical protein OHK0040_13870 [bacterium]